MQSSPACYPRFERAITIGSRHVSSGIGSCGAMISVRVGHIIGSFPLNTGLRCVSLFDNPLGVRVAPMR